MFAAGRDEEKKQLAPISAISIIMDGRDASGMLGNLNLKTPTMAKVAIKILNKQKIIRQQTGLKNLLNEI